MTKISTWEILLNSLFDGNHHGRQMIPGVNLLEWAKIIQHDLDEIDRLYLDYDVIGGE